MDFCWCRNLWRIVQVWDVSIHRHTDPPSLLVYEVWICSTLPVKRISLCHASPAYGQHIGCTV
eukprot:1547616-Amphidinium_carterae.1